MIDYLLDKMVIYYGLIFILLLKSNILDKILTFQTCPTENQGLPLYFIQCGQKNVTEFQGFIFSAHSSLVQAAVQYARVLNFKVRSYRF